MLFTKIGSSYSSSQFPAAFSNQLYFSENVNFGEFTYQSSYSIKYILSGYETYSVEGREMLIKPQQHLLVNNNSQVTTLPASGKAMSIFIAPETLMDVKSTNGNSSIETILDNYNCLQEQPFLLCEKVYNHENSKLNEQLNRLVIMLLNEQLSGEHEADPSIFFNLAEALLMDQQVHASRINGLKSIKKSTIQEQYNRLLIGYQFLNDNWNQPFSLKKTAAVAMLSPYHFHRLFQVCFSITPYQYHLDLQMKKALELLRKNEYKISEIAYLLGYGSLTAFGRTFKKYFGSSPSTIHK